MNLVNLQDYKINTQKSHAFIQTNNERSEREIKENIQFTIATQKRKYLGINLPKEEKNLYSEKCKISLIKEIKDNTSTWREIPCSWIGSVNIVKMTLLPKASYRFSAIPYQITNDIFHKIRTKNCTIYMETQETPKQSKQF